MWSGKDKPPRPKAAPDPRGRRAPLARARGGIGGHEEKKGWDGVGGEGDDARAGHSGGGGGAWWVDGWMDGWAWKMATLAGFGLYARSTHKRGAHRKEEQIATVGP